MANRVAGILSQMFRFGIHRAIVEATPVQLLYRPGGKEKPRARVLSEEELRAFLRNLDDVCRFQRLPHVLRVLLLTLQRRSELALAEWREFDFKTKTWTIPDAHAKTGKGHGTASAKSFAVSSRVSGSAFIPALMRASWPAVFHLNP